VSTGDFQAVLTALLGKDAPNLSPAVITRLTAVWQADYDAWQKRDLSARRYVYVWADGVYLQARMEAAGSSHSGAALVSTGLLKAAQPGTLQRVDHAPVLVTVQPSHVSGTGRNLWLDVVFVGPKKTDDEIEPPRAAHRRMSETEWPTDWFHREPLTDARALMGRRTRITTCR
jgi:hypothetical protein